MFFREANREGEIRFLVAVIDGGSITLPLVEFVADTKRGHWQLEDIDLAGGMDLVNLSGLGQCALRTKGNRTVDLLFLKGIEKARLSTFTLADLDGDHDQDLVGKSI